jgi:hypothetical protein
LDGWKVPQGIEVARREELPGDEPAISWSPPHGGVTWQQVGSDLDGEPFAIAVDPNVPGRLWAGTNHRIFVLDPEP